MFASNQNSDIQDVCSEAAPPFWHFHNSIFCVLRSRPPGLQAWWTSIHLFLSWNSFFIFYESWNLWKSRVTLFALSVGKNFFFLSKAYWVLWRNLLNLENYKSTLWGNLSAAGLSGWAVSFLEVRGILSYSCIHRNVSSVPVLMGDQN